MPRAHVPKYHCQHARCSFICRGKSKAEKHSKVEHFECPFCGPSGGLYTFYWYKEHLESFHPDDCKVGPIVPGKNVYPSTHCRFAPRCPFTAAEPSKRRLHSRRFHLECPVNGCNVVLTKWKFSTHIRDQHCTTCVVQCPRDGCPRSEMLLKDYWYHARTHSDKGEDNACSSDQVDEPQTIEDVPCSETSVEHPCSETDQPLSPSAELLDQIDSDARDLLDWFETVGWDEELDEQE